MSVSKKQAIREFKEKKTPRGVFAVRCTVTGALWVGSSPNLDAARNSIWFGLRLGTHHNPSLQKEWNLHGESAFEYEVLEKLDDDVAAMAVSDLLKEKKREKVARLGALALL